MSTGIMQAFIEDCGWAIEANALRAASQGVLAGVAAFSEPAMSMVFSRLAAEAKGAAVVFDHAIGLTPVHASWLWSQGVAAVVPRPAKEDLAMSCETMAGLTPY
jgi:hypothetical protein